MKRLIALSLLCATASCSETPLDLDEAAPARELPALAAEVPVIEKKPIAGGAATLTLEINVLDPWMSATADTPPDGWSGDYHFEAQVRYAAAVLGGRAAGDFVPYLDVNLTLRNLETDQTKGYPLLLMVGVAEGWHYGVDVDLDGDLGVSEAGYEATVSVARSGDLVVVHSDLLDARAGTFLGTQPITVTGAFTLDDLAAGGGAAAEGDAAEGGAAEEESEAPSPGIGYGY